MRDLVEISVKLVRDEEPAKVRARAREAAEERLLDLLLPRRRARAASADRAGAAAAAPQPTRRARSCASMLRDGKLDDREVEVDVAEDANPLMFEVFGGARHGRDRASTRQAAVTCSARSAARRSARSVKVPQALELLTGEEVEQAHRHGQGHARGGRRAENAGIVFIDEIDKIAGEARAAHGGPDVSREGVQRDLLPIVEGSTVTTKYGPVQDRPRAVHRGRRVPRVASRRDLIPELQGRFPIRVELEPLTGDDFVRILTEPENALTRQYAALLATEGVTHRVDRRRDRGDRAHRRRRQRAHARTSARAGCTPCMERLLDELSFEAPGLGGTEVPITAAYVRERLAKVFEDEDLSKYIL